MFAIEPGMGVRDTRGRVIGTVQDVRASGTGVVQQVLVDVGNRTATLPAANFSGSGDALISGMGKSKVKKKAKQQEKTAAAQPAAGSTGSREAQSSK